MRFICALAIAAFATIFGGSRSFAEHQITVLHRFSMNDAADGFNPQHEVSFDPKSGALFGTTTYGGDMNLCPFLGKGCGVAFALTPDGTGSPTVFHVLHTFEYTGDGNSDGSYPESVTIDGEGSLYGVTSQGGGSSTSCNDSTIGCGVVYMLVAPLLHDKPPKERIIHYFYGNDGAFPETRLVLDQSTGTLYGTTTEGGDSSLGVVFSLTPNADKTKWAYAIVCDFAAAGEQLGAGPVGPVLQDLNGNLYGTTSAGGTRNHGVVYELSPHGASWTESVLLNFHSKKTGASPQMGLTMDASGDLFGTTEGVLRQRRQCFQPEVVFEISPHKKSWRSSILQHFRGCRKGDEHWAKGVEPAGDMLDIDGAGNLYGALKLGGKDDGEGKIYELSNNEAAYGFKTLFTFCGGDNCTDGETPTGISRGLSGDLYGATEYGGTGKGGVVFMLTH